MHFHSLHSLTSCQPYTTAVVDWYKLAVIIPQQNVHHTLDYIENMSKEEICERRLMAYDFFHTYVKTGKERLNAIVKVMDERLRTGRLFQFQAAPGIASHPAVSQCISTRVTQRNKSDIRGIKTHCLLFR